MVVGIGASAGGLEALRPFVANLPEVSNLAYIVAQHMSPQHRSMMVELLARESTIPVEEAKTGTQLRPNTIYVAPPNSDVMVQDDKVILRKPLTEIGPKPSVDKFFTSLAEYVGERAIGVVLSGTGSDGAHGVRAIKAAGGISIAQTPESAKYGSMPQAAIRAGADLILEPPKIAMQLMSIATRPRMALQDTPEPSDEGAVESIIRNINRVTGMDFSNYKESTIHRQIERRMVAHQIQTLDGYREATANNEDELRQLAQNFLICVTSFFRDANAFKALRAVVVDMLSRKRVGDPIRIWVPGCATGEEAYSIAILLSEILGNNLSKYRIQIFATDINTEATAFGRRGQYPETSVDGLPKEILDRYFTAVDRVFHVDRVIRDMVVFARQDLAQDPPFVRIDLISCRNLLIYFKPNLQERIFKIFHYALNGDGVLFLGASEAMASSQGLFSDLDRKFKLFRKRNVPASYPATFGRMSESIGSATLSKAEPAPAVSVVDLGRDLLLEQFAPPGILLTKEGDILHVFGDISPVCQVRPGNPDFGFYTIVDPDLKTSARALIRKALDTRDTASSPPIRLHSSEERRLCRISVRPVSGAGSQDLALITFETSYPSRVSPTEGETELDETAAERISELEHELTSTRENLQTVVEELETSNEELQSLNEELQASNEELQASNEELETANEEMQATNEELT
ncbi:MAG: chemotaxis protein CheB, partial [Rhodospirillales bacterium]